ncbi:MAG: hypothetical protein M3237_23665 [Actinomycetota bacterium]|nr:hypothetical protein [Actinomycetota bacterium]
MTCSQGKRPARRALLSALALGLAASLAAILPTTGASAAAGPTDEQLAADQAPIPATCGRPPLDGCRLAWYGAQAPTLVLWGDSHMWMMTPAVQKAAAGTRVNVVLFFAGGCIPAAPDMTIYAGNACAELSISAMRYLQQLEASGRPYRLLLGSFWGANLDRVFWYEGQERADIMKQRRVYTQSYTRPLFRALGRAGIPTDVSLQGPISVPPSECGLGAWPFWCPVNRNRAYYKDGYVRGWLARRMSHLGEGARLVDYSRGICSATSCPAVVDGVHTWFDPYHVSATKAGQLASYYKPTVRALLRSR